MPAPWEADVVLADGGSAHIRPVRPDDGPALRDLYESLSDDSRYLRFLSPAPASLAGHLGPKLAIDDRHFGLVAEIGDHIVAIADYHRRLDDTAEVAFTVRDDHQGRGLGTLLLEHLAEVALAHGIRRFVATLLSRNDAMRSVFRDAGFAVTWARPELGITDVTLDLAPTSEFADARAARERAAEAMSVARLLSPASIAVVGAGRRRDSIGNAIFRNLVAGGYHGPVYPVNPNATEIEGREAFPSVRAVPGEVELVVVAVPAHAVEAVTRECVDKRVRGMVVVSSGFAELGAEQLQEDLVRLARRNGMRIVGPNCIGIVNTNPAVSMNATFAPVTPERGRVGFGSQSGGIGIELLARARSLGVGVSTFVSLGNKADVSVNDLLQYWDLDGDTSVILLYVESFGNPRKFARLARRIARTKPIVAIKSGRTPAGARGASSHTAALANPDVAVDQLFRQAGVVRVDTLEQLLDTAGLLVHQPLPPGRRVAVVGNGGGPGILAADACVAAGLDVPELSAAVQAQLRAVAPAGAGVTNPVDLVASAGAEVYERAIGILLESAEIDAIIVIYVSPLVSRPEDVARAVVTAARAAGATPVVACFLGGDRAGGPLGGTDGARPVPTFAFPESAADALARAAWLAEWRQAPAGTVPRLDGVTPGTARELVDRALGRQPAGGWVDVIDAAEMLRAYGLAVVPTRRAASADEAAAHASEVGYPVALKAGAAELVHKTDVGGVRLGLDDADAVRRAYDEMRALLGEAMGGALVQPMAAPGVELIVGVTHDPVFGPLVLLGMGGVTAELVRDTTLRIVPVTDVDAYDMVRSLRTSPLLFGYRNTAPVDVAALEDVLLRVGRLAEDLPEVAELDCNPVVVSETGALVLDVKLRLVPRPTAAAAPSLPLSSTPLPYLRHRTGSDPVR